MLTSKSYFYLKFVPHQKLKSNFNQMLKPKFCKNMRLLKNLGFFSTGLKKSSHLFKEGFITGTVPENVSGVKVKNPVQGSQKLFTKEDIENLKEELDVVLSDRSCGSKYQQKSWTIGEI